ncbi:MAG TPA: nucleotide exchange factor GrpE [Acetivibrio sp.]|nr:nucleotide exchange factor GrpE [Acetivibrio sp.]HPT90086.1 nucleotide exchange factor GrpE [Acetivibrio sp.]HQA58857.1 nucleotide exchange factor GrpE [Acetivibrio sp.]
MKEKETDNQKEKEQDNCQTDNNEEVNNEETNQNDNIPEKEESACNQEMEQLKNELEEKSKKCEEYFNMLQRTAAEFDNYKKRTAKEKESIYTDATVDVIAAFLPVVDNIERAIAAFSNEIDAASLKEGVDLVYRQFKDVMGKLGVEEIKSVGEKFDPNLHNAVMHVEDPEYDESVIIEEFQKGYILKDRVIRYSMVKVAN